MGTFSAIILGAVQGITEFLPISSTGHLILVHKLLGTGNVSALAFDAVLHLATTAAVALYFFSELTVLVQTLFRKLGRLPVNERDVTLLYALMVGTIPAVVLGLFLESFMESAFRNPLLVALVLFLGSVLFMVAEYRYNSCYHNNDIDIPRGFKIGLFQSLALIPGMSRSGASIAGGMLLGLSRTDATRFSFLLAIPIMLGAGGKKLFELISSQGDVNWGPIIAGALVASAVGILAIHFMLGFVRKYSLWPFIWYRIILAGFIVFVTFFG